MKALRAALAAALVTLAAASAANAADPASLYDAPGQRHAVVCVQLAGSSAPLRFADGTADGFTLSNNLSFENGDCPTGNVRLDLHELIPAAGGSLVFHRGGNGYADDQNVKYGELATSDIAGALPDPVPSGGGRGAACTLATGPAYRASIASIPDEMHYKRPQDVAGGSNNGASFMHYGDPGADQGDRHDIHYSYLLWSFVDVRGGGMVRTLIAPNQVIRPCDVDPIEMDSWDSAGNVNGHVTARYVRMQAGSCPVYGWMVWTHDWFGDSNGPVAHATQAQTPPPADPPPAANCPAAAPAAPPGVTTGDAAPADYTTFTLGGTIDTKAVPTTYRFEFGGDTNYGRATAPQTIGAGAQPVPISAQAGALEPNTVYHYRLVAENTHGQTVGDDRTFTTPPPPPPPPPPPAPPEVHAAAVPVSISGLRVSPSAFRRARSRTRSAARITWTASGPARVTLTFAQKTLGYRRGAGTCRVLPGGRLPRGARRCTVWVIVPGSLGASANAGPNTFAFSGWLGRRALEPGAYRVQAVAIDSTGLRGTARRAGFTIKR